MKKVLIIGSPGSGKSTFARKLHNITNLPIIHLDMLNWNSDKTTVSKTVFEKRIQAAISEKHNWIMDGNYLATMPMRLKKCDTIFLWTILQKLVCPVCKIESEKNDQICLGLKKNSILSSNNISKTFEKFVALIF